MNKKDKLNVMLEDIARLNQEDFDTLLNWMIVEFKARAKAREEKIRRAFNDKY